MNSELKKLKGFDLNKYLIIPVRQRLSSIFVDQEQMDAWIHNWKFFFILAFGRSGTAFMADLLDKSPGSYVFHEPVLEDFFAHARAHHDPQNANVYLRRFRKKEIFTRMRHIPSGSYGEVNSLLRCHAEAIAKAFPGVVLIHLVRDGRDVIRSTFGRRTMTIRNPFSRSIHPADSDPWKAHWSEMDRFARICWFWQEENRRLRTTIGKPVQLERILSSYEYFRDEILGPCQLNIKKKDWEFAITSPRNTTSKFQMPKWNLWTTEQQKTFRKICGEEMENCGYSF